MSIKRNEELISRYRSRALYGGGFFGVIIGAVGMAPFLKGLHSPGLAYIGAIAGGAVAGAGLGYLFLEIIIGQSAAQGQLHSGSVPGQDGDAVPASAGDAGSSDGGGGGDGGGDGGGGGD